MKKFVLSALCATSLIGGSALFARSAPLADPKPAPAAAPQTIEAKPALWVVKDEDTTIYLFGTVHVLKPNISWFKGDVKSAYDASSEVVFELVDLDDPSVFNEAEKLARDPGGKTFTSRLSAKQQPIYKAGMEKLGIPVAMLDGYRPWMVSLTVTQVQMQKAGYRAGAGAETVIMAAAKKDGKKLIGLEKATQQLGWLASLDDKWHVDGLIEGFKQGDAAFSILDKLVDAWVAGDAARLGKLLNKGLKPGTKPFQLLLADRNARWAEWIDTRLDTPGTVFLAVGAGHLAGKSSVQDYMAQRKIKTVRVNGK